MMYSKFYQVTFSLIIISVFFVSGKLQGTDKETDIIDSQKRSSQNNEVLKSMVTDPVAIKKQLLALKFLDDIKVERERKRGREKEKRGEKITKRIGKKSNSTSHPEQQVEASSDYVSFFDDFDNSLFSQEETEEYPEEETTTAEPTITSTTTTTSTIRPSQTTSAIDDWQPLFRGSSIQGFGEWLGGVNNRFPVSYADVQPQFVFPINLDGGNEIQYVQAKSASMPATEKIDKSKEPPSSKPDKKTKKYTTYRIEETTEIPIIHGIPGDFVEVSLPPPNSIAEVLEPITRVIYREKKRRDYNSNAKDDALSMYPTKKSRSIDRDSNRYSLQQQQTRGEWEPVSTRRRDWRGSRRMGSGRRRRNAFPKTYTNPNSENQSHDNFVVPLTGYENDATARQDFDDGLTTTSGVLNADSFSEFDSGSEGSRYDPPFEYRNSEVDSGIRGPQDFYSDRGPPPPQDRAPPGGSGGYGYEGYDTQSNPNNPDASDPNAPYAEYDPNQAQDGQSQYPEGQSQYPEENVANHGSTGPGTTGEGDDGYNSNNNNNEYQTEEEGSEGQAGGNAQGRDDPEDIYFDHDFKTMGGPEPAERVKPRTFFEDFRGFYTSSNEFAGDGGSSEGRGGGSRGRSRGKPRGGGQPDGFGSFEEDEDDTTSYPPPRRPGRRPPPPPNPEDYEDEGPPPPVQGRGRGRRYRNKNNVGYPEEPHPEEDYPEAKPQGYGRNRPNGYGRQYGNGRGSQPNTGDVPVYTPEAVGNSGGQRNWGSSNGASFPQLRSSGRPGSLNYGYFRRRNNNYAFPGNLFG